MGDGKDDPAKPGDKAKQEEAEETETTPATNGVPGLKRQDSSKVRVSVWQLDFFYL